MAGRGGWLPRRSSVFPAPIRPLLETRIRPQFRRSEAGDDDSLDALVLLLTAGRLARGEAILLGEPGARDGCGLPMRIAV